MGFEQRCKNGHYYDTAKHTTCPHCGIGDLGIGNTEGKRGSDEHQPTLPKESRGREAPEGSTVGLYTEVIGIDPPVGWLVCIDGPDRGRDYRIHAANNSIGRSETMAICITGDDNISRENHAFLIYDPETNTYAVRPGVARGLVHLNRGLVHEATPLRPFDEIKIGKTTLLFIPLCGDFGGKSFRWT